MTPNERALLLAVAKRLTTPLNKFKGQTYIDLVETIIAVEAEDKPDTMQATLDTFEKILHAAAYDPEPLTEGPSEFEINASIKRVSALMPSSEDMRKAMRDAGLLIEPKPAEAVCPVCKGTGMTVFNACQDMCWTCDGTGKKEKK